MGRDGARRYRCSGQSAIIIQPDVPANRQFIQTSTDCPAQQDGSTTGDDPVEEEDGTKKF